EICSRWALPWSRFPVGWLWLLNCSKARAYAFDEAHVDDFLVFYVGLENAGLTHDRTAGCPGLLADHAVLAPHLIPERAVKRGLKVLKRHGGKLLLGDLGGLVGIGVKEFQSLDHPLDEAAHHLGLLLDRIEAHVDGGISVGPQFLGHVEERLAPDVLPDSLRDHGLGGVADHRLTAAHG